MTVRIQVEKYRISAVIPITWKEKVNIRAREMGYTSVADYLRSLVREDLEEAGLLKPGDDQG
ncbi:MAG: hypothetical protein QXM14_01345 [Fervidicoccaceae archaeon]